MFFTPPVDCVPVSGYHDEESSFGLVKKGIYKPSSDFNFDFVADIICNNPHDSGYMVHVTSERSHACYKSLTINSVIYNIVC